MMRLKIKYGLLLSVLFIFLLGCKDELSPDDNSYPKDTIKVSFNIRIPDYNSPTAESHGNSFSKTALSLDQAFSVDIQPNEVNNITRSEGKTSLYNLWIFQFDESGNKVLSNKMSDLPSPVKDMITIETDLVAGKNQTIYLVSLGSKVSDDLSGIKTIKDLEVFNFAFFNNVDGNFVPKVTSEADMPYSGFASGLTIKTLDSSGRGYIDFTDSNSFSGAIMLKTMLAKVEFHFKYIASGFTPVSLSLKNVPANFAVDPSKYTNNTYVNSTLIKIDNTLEKDDQDRYVVTWFIPNNPKGVVSTVKKESDRNSTKAPADATYIEVTASEDRKPIMNAFYSIYLGANDITDFNVNAHTLYTIRTDFTIGQNSNDKRIVYRSTAFSLAENNDSVPPAVLPASSTFVYYNRDGHFDCRRFVLNVLKGYIKIELKDGNGNLLDPNNSWLYISRFSNYTAAKLNNDLKTTYEYNAELSSQIIFYLYSDEYIDKDYFSIPDPVRKAKVMASIMSSADSPIVQSATSFSVNQLPGQYIGSFGGKFDEETGEYSDGLMMEVIDETRVRIPEDGPYSSVNDTYWGFSNQKTIGLYDTDNFYSGEKATWEMVHNTSNLVVNKGNVSNENPRFNSDGSPDLYQYGRRGSYAARYCFNKNRDLDGDGVIRYTTNPETNEYRWYLPSYFQILGINLQANYLLNFHSDITKKLMIFNENGAYLSVFTSNESNAIGANHYYTIHALYGFFYYGQLDNFLVEKTAGTRSVVCVRNVPKRKL